MNEINIGTKVAMVLTDMPLGVSVGKEHFYLYPQTDFYFFNPRFTRKITK